MKKLNMKELQMKSKPWVSRYLAKLIEHRNKLFRKKRRSNPMKMLECYTTSSEIK